MPAKFVKSYAAPDGQIFPTLEEEQKHEISQILFDNRAQLNDAETSILGAVMVNKDAILACLKQKERKNLRAPKVKKATRKTKNELAKTNPVPA